MMDIHLDHFHSSAVCREIGERLAMDLGPPSQDLPPRLLALLERLAKLEVRAPSP